jgi:hypothetical protein
MDDWELFVLGIITYQILKMFALIINRMVVEHRQKRLLKLVQVIFPDNEKVTFITVDASDKRAMAKIEREVRSHYDVEDSESLHFDPFPQEGQVREDQDRSGDRYRDGDARKAAPRHRKDPPR